MSELGLRTDELMEAKALLHLQMFNHVLWKELYIERLQPDPTWHIYWRPGSKGPRWLTVTTAAYMTSDILYYERTLRQNVWDPENFAPAKIEPRPNRWSGLHEVAWDILACDPVALDLARDVLAKGG